jgi:hypothetical protein
MCHSHSSVLFYWQLSITSHYTHVCLSHSSVLFIDNFLSHHTIPTCVRHIPVSSLLTTFYHITLYPRVSVTFCSVVYWQLSITSHYTPVCQSHSSVLFIDNFLSHHTIPTCVRHIPVCCLLTTFYRITLYPRVSDTFQCVVYWQLSITSHYTHMCQSHSVVLFIDNFLSHHTIPTCVGHIP